MLFIHLVHHAEGRILPLAKPRAGVRRGNLLPSGRGFQRQSRSLLHRSPCRSEGNNRRSHHCHSSASQGLGWQIVKRL